MADDIKNCRELDEHLAPYVDGEEAPRRAASVEAHLAGCPPCHEHADCRALPRATSSTSIATTLRAAAPAELRARCAALQSSAFAKAPPAASGASRQSRSVRRWAAAVARGLAGARRRRRVRLRPEQPGRGARGEPGRRSREVLQGDRQRGARRDRRSRSATGSRTRAGRLSCRRAARREQLKLVDVRRCFSTRRPRGAHDVYLARRAAVSLYVLPEQRRARSASSTSWGTRRRSGAPTGGRYAVVASRPATRTSPKSVDYMKAHVR